MWIHVCRYGCGAASPRGVRTRPASRPADTSKMSTSASKVGPNASKTLYQAPPQSAAEAQDGRRCCARADLMWHSTPYTLNTLHSTP